jgi:regulator of cell morphogenesis and NO signaling
LTRHPISAALMRQHREIGAAIEFFIEKLEGGSTQTELVAAMLEALRRHIYLEEVFLFPPIREAGIVVPIIAMMREHGQLWATMESLTQLLTELEDSPRLKATCTQLLDQLHKHSFTEEPAIYLHANYELSASTSEELTRFVVTGRLPEGWICQRAKS